MLKELSFPFNLSYFCFTAKKFTKFYANWSSSIPDLETFFGDDQVDGAEVDPDDLVDRQRDSAGLERYPLRSAFQTQPKPSAAATALDTDSAEAAEVDTEIAVYRWAHHAWMLYLRFCDARDIPETHASAYKDLTENPALMAFVSVHVAGKKR